MGGGGGIITMLNQNLAHKKLILKAVRNIFQLKVVSCRNQSIYLLGLPWIGFCFLLKGICQYYLLILNFYKFVMHCSWTNHWSKPCKSTREMSKDKQEITFDYDFSQFHSSLLQNIGKSLQKLLMIKILTMKVFAYILEGQLYEKASNYQSKMQAKSMEKVYMQVFTVCFVITAALWPS